jgi:hypothetical protein
VRVAIGRDAVPIGSLCRASKIGSTNIAEMQFAFLHITFTFATLHTLAEFGALSGKIIENQSAPDY